jgi:hypothetical protein
VDVLGRLVGPDGVDGLDGLAVIGEAWIGVIGARAEGAMDGVDGREWSMVCLGCSCGLFVARL